MLFTTESKEKKSSWSSCKHDRSLTEQTYGVKFFIPYWYSQIRSWSHQHWTLIIITINKITVTLYAYLFEDNARGNYWSNTWSYDSHILYFYSPNFYSLIAINTDNLVIVNYSLSFLQLLKKHHLNENVFTFHFDNHTCRSNFLKRL